MNNTSQVLRDQARAAAQRATKNTSDTEKPAAATADENSTAPVDPPPTPHSAPPPPPPAPPSLPAEAADRPTPPSAPPVSPKIAVPALPAASTVATFNEVHDEILLENKEVKVLAIANFENCPDPSLSEDYFISLQKFISSENHLARNISNIKADYMSSRILQSQLCFHTASVEISVMSENLWELADVYIQRHLAKSDW